MNRTTERIYPYALSISAAGIFHYSKAGFPTGEGVLSASITIGAIFVGFLATVMSIVLTIQSARIEELRATKFFGLMIGYLQEAIWGSLAFCALSLFGYFLLSQPPKPLPFWFQDAWLLFSSATFLTFFRITRALLGLVSLSEGTGSDNTS